MSGRPPSRNASISHSRNTSRAGVGIPTIPTAASTSTSASRSQSPRPGGTLERKGSISSNPHAHHRQASVVNGGIQHSRSTSNSYTPVTSPLSPPQNVMNMATLTSRDQITIPDIPASPPLPGMNPTMSGTTLDGTMTSTTLTGSAYSTYNSMSSMTNADTIRGSSTTSRSGQSRGTKKEHQHSLSHHHIGGSEPKTPAEYALHILFTQFVQIAETKISQCLAVNLNAEPDVEAICGAGADPAFDKLIGSLGYIARHKPRPVIDSVMLWRKSKSEAATVARSELNKLHQLGKPQNPLANVKHQDAMSSLIRRNTEPTQPFESHGPGMHSNASLVSLSSKENSAAADRRSTIAIYILCRVLIEVIGQTTLDSITEEMADKLEDIIFNQLRSADPEVLASSPLRMGNWTLFAQLLGVMSTIHFESVSDRLFLSDLERNSKGFLSKEAESKAELVIRGMSYLKLKLYPPDAFEEGCEFMILLTKLFLAAQGQRLKHAYCELYMKLLLPISGKGASEFNMPRWTEFIQTLYPKLTEMCQKQRHWPMALPLFGVLLCCTPNQFFVSNWMSLLDSNVGKLKDRSTRVMMAQMACRLVWTYLYRCPEKLNDVFKKLENVVKIFFPKRSLLSGAEPDLMEAYIQMIRIIGYKHQDFCFRYILSPLLNADVILATNSFSVEQLSPERMIIGIRAFLAIMNDLENPDEPPPFPQKFESTQTEKIPPTSTWLAKFDSERTEAMKKLDRMSRPLPINRFGATVKEYCEKFSEILGRITLICDTNFGGKALIDERFNHSQPKTPVTATFSFNLDHPTPDQKQSFYALLNNAFTALPRALPPNISFAKLVEILCHGTAHSDYNVAVGASNALKCIARQSTARQRVIIGFARFIFDFDEKYATTYDGGMLGSNHIENTLKLYVELLRIWIEAIKQKTKTPAFGESAPVNILEPTNSRMDDLEIANVRAVVDEIESHGLFFLSSQSRIVRKFAIMVLRLITEFDSALEEHHDSEGGTITASGQPRAMRDSTRFTRIIHVLEYDSLNVMNQNVNDEKWSVADRSRLRQELSENKSQNALIGLCTSDNQYDASLWFKLFPRLIKICFERFPLTVVQCRDSICSRLLQMHPQMTAVAESTKPQFDGTMQKPGAPKNPTTPLEIAIEQWKLYLIVACTTLTLINDQNRQAAGSGSTHARKTSRTAGTGGTASSSAPYERLFSGRTLFQMVTPFLGSDNSGIREAVVTGLGSINVNLYKTLLECLVPHSRWNEPSQYPPSRGGQRQPTPTSGGIPRRTPRTDRLRTEITHIMQLTSHLLQQREIYSDITILSHMVGFIKDMKQFLNDAEMDSQHEYNRLRRYFCGLLEELYDALLNTENPERWLPFEGRTSLYYLLERWGKQSRDRAQEAGVQANISAHIEIERNDLRTAALSAMASLCYGPISKNIENKATATFNVFGAFNWLDTIFSESSDRLHRIGRRALKNLLMSNKDNSHLISLAVRQCYLYRPNAKGVESYFTVVSEVLLTSEDFPCGLWKSIALALYKIGDDDIKIRTKAAALLRGLQERHETSNTVLDFEVSISDRTMAVYKRAQFELSVMMAQQYPKQAFLVFSEFTYFFNLVDSKSQRDLLAVLLPWVQALELTQDPNGSPAQWSYMVLVNLFEIMVKFGPKLHNEVEALWAALATAPYGGNVKVILDFIISQSLERKEQNFVAVGKQIIVFIAQTNPGKKLTEALLAYIQPKLMSIQSQEPYHKPDPSQFPHLADLSSFLPHGGKQHGFSRGHLGLILLVDLVVKPDQPIGDNLPLLLQVVFILWDHYVPLVQEQAREMLVHLVHEFALSNQSQNNPAFRSTTRDFVDMVRTRKAKTNWAYDEVAVDNDQIRVPGSMSQMVKEVLNIFATEYPNIKDHWSKIALTWATNCPVRHLACRSFQVFRCLLTTLDQTMLADMLARLSNTIADNSADIQSFAMEILISINSVVNELDGNELLQFPQLFWAIVACLYTIHEKEFMEILSVLEKYMDKVNLGDPNKVEYLLSMLPHTWEGKFEGLQSLIVKGLRSSVSLERTLQVLDKMSLLPSNHLIGGSDRLLNAVLANLPRFLSAAEKETVPQEDIVCAERLLALAEAEQQPEIARCMSVFASQRFRSKEVFKTLAVGALKDTYFPGWEAPTLIFLVGLLFNDLSWFKLKVMELLKTVIPYIDMKKPEFAGLGADLISPLLRLLQTEYCQQALEVLDKVIAISGSKMDKQVVRMSLGNRTLRKEFERTETLFGIPEDSGWSIPMPAIMASTTRANVHAVFYTCQPPQTPEDVTPNPDLQFQLEDYNYAGFQDRTGTMLSEDARGDTLGDVVGRLDNLDMFFADESVNGPVQPHHEAEQSQDMGESAPQIYDSRVYHILNRSLQRTPSVTSFKNTFADSLSTPMQAAHPPMTPTLFAAPPMPMMGKGGVPNRGILSPEMAAMQAGELPSDSSSDDGEYDDSDTDDDQSDTKSESPFLLESLLRSAGQKAKSGVNAARTLRKTREKEKEEAAAAAAAAAAASSGGGPSSIPSVPSVPSMAGMSNVPMSGTMSSAASKPKLDSRTSPKTPRFNKPSLSGISRQTSPGV